MLFIPGNAGSYKQVRPLAAESATYFHDAVQNDPSLLKHGVRNLDFFTVDFNEDFTAFHGQTMIDQAEYLNEAIRYILSLYLDPRMTRRDSNLPDPTSVIVVGHSMGGIVARTMLIMPNYQAHSINTILTMSAPHARPPVSFDGEIVRVYDEINEYWRKAYAQQWANNNPLWHVTLISIAGGSLDTVVPSDYASLESIVPDTHGFTVFTSTIPTVWTSMDHQAILWCDQHRKVVIRALYNIVDAHRPSQTKPRASRMSVFKRHFLTGLEHNAERPAVFKEPDTLLTLEDDSHEIVTQGERLVLRGLGKQSKPRAHLVPIPPLGTSTRRFTLLTDETPDATGESGKLEVLLCSVHSFQPGQAGTMLPWKLDLSPGESKASTRLVCKNAAADAIQLPASTRSTHYPFSSGARPTPPFSFFQYDLEDIAEYQFVAVVEKGIASPGFVVAEFSDLNSAQRTRHISLRRMLAFGMDFRLPANRPTVTEITIPAIQSSLLAYKLHVSEQGCGNRKELFAPLVRQYLEAPYESKYFVNARHASISLHGVAPYVPPPLKAKSAEDGLSFQFWTDPTCNASINVRLTVDVLGSLGKLYMRYRTAFAAFPLLVVALVVRKQFRVYDNQGIFVSFNEALEMCLRRSVPLIFASLTLLSVSVGTSGIRGAAAFWPFRNAHLAGIDFRQNDLLAGTQDPFFWFMVPLIGVCCVGVCWVMNYLALALTAVFSALYGWLNVRPAWSRHDMQRRSLPHGFMPSSPRRRLVTTAVLLLLVTTFIPYQFAYVVACLVQLMTTVRAHRIASELPSNANRSFYNYAHAIFVLMLWVLPINIPILIVWVRNLTVHWFTPFSSHHNVIAISPFIVLVETFTAGKMVPRLAGRRLRHVTSVLLFGVAVYAAIYGVSHAYLLHNLVNVVAAWLVVVHSTADSWSWAGWRTLFEGNIETRKAFGKTP